MALIDKIKEQEEKKELSKYDVLVNEHESLNRYLEYINRHNHLGYSSAISKNRHTCP